MLFTFGLIIFFNTAAHVGVQSTGEQRVHGVHRARDVRRVPVRVPGGRGAPDAALLPQVSRVLHRSLVG
jgi:hypothetical protein